MSTATLDFLQHKRINSFQKLVFLLFLHQNPGVKGTSQYFAERLYLGNLTLIEQMIAEFKEHGIMDSNGQYHFLQNTPELNASLDHLHRLFEEPATRQSLLEQVRHRFYYNQN